MRTARILLDDYAGMESELTAINQYVYQHIISEEKYEDLADALLGISIAEMEHLELLGSAILNLGGDPIYKSSNGRMWNSAFVQYVKNPKVILMVNIQGEKTAIRNYRRTIEMTNNVQVKKLIERIILDEELHIQIFEKLLKQFEMCEK